MPRALLSVSDKRGLVEFARGLAEHHPDWRLIVLVLPGRPGSRRRR